MASITIALLTLLLASISFINNNQFLIAQSNAVLTKPQDVQANLTTAFDSLMNPKVLLGSAIDQIRNSTARSVSGNNETAADKATISVIDPRILILSHQIIPPKDFILVYAAIPLRILSGQVAAKLPCDSNSRSPLQIRVGQPSDIRPVQLKLITALSQPGYVCMYYANVTSTTHDSVVTPEATSKDSNVPNIPRSEGVGPAVRAGNLTITYIELFNPTDNRVVFPSTASLSISDILLTSLQQPDHTISATRVNQTSTRINETTPANNTTVVNEKPTEITPNQLTRAGISPAIAFVYNAWNPYLKQKTYLPISPLVNDTILSNSKCDVHAIWHSPKEEQSDLAELKEYSTVTTKNSGNAPMHLYMCGGAPIP
jgi:hypothetical protein